MKKSFVPAIMLAMILAVGASAAPYCVFKNSAIILDADSLANCDGVPVLKPVLIAKNIPTVPAGIELNTEWLILMAQHPDSIIALGPKKDSLSKFFWRGIIPKHRDRIILIGRARADSSFSPIKWQEGSGKKITSVSLIIAIALMSFISLLAGLSLRVKELGLIVITMSLAALALTVLMLLTLGPGLTDLALFMAMVALAVSLFGMEMLAISLALATIESTIISVSFFTGSWTAFIILNIVVTAIFFAAWYLKIGSTK
jgi:hypothetical protein